MEIERELALPRLPPHLLNVARRFVIAAVLGGLRGNKGDLKPDLVGRDSPEHHLAVVGDRNSVTLRYAVDSRLASGPSAVVIALDFNSSGNSWFVTPTWTGSDMHGRSQAQNMFQSALGANFRDLDEMLEQHRLELAA